MVETNSCEKILVDSGAEGLAYIDLEFASRLGLSLERLETPMEVLGVDGQPLAYGNVEYLTSSYNLNLGKHIESIRFHVIKSPTNPIILGFDWLELHNPMIDWKSGAIEFSRCKCIPNENGENGNIPEVKIMNSEAFKKMVVKEKASIYLALIGQSPTRAQANVSVCSLAQTDRSEEHWIIGKFPGVFSENEFPDLPPHRQGVDLSIDLLPGKEAPFGPIYSLSLTEEKALREYIEKATKSGIIRPSQSSAGSPVMFVRKKDGSLRLCVDFRGLNAVTESNRAALPIIKDMIQRTLGSRVFSKIDLKSAFNLIRIHEGHEHLTAFRTKYGHFEYLVMPFGLKNAPGHFQSFVNKIFGDIIDQGLLVFIDDLLIYADSQEKHDLMLNTVMERLLQHNLKVNSIKCEFSVSQVEFLGHFISHDGIRMASSKLKDILEWELPRNLKDVRSFLGLANYYRDFIPNFSQVAQPLVNLTRHDVPFDMDQNCVQAFQQLKQAFLDDTVLIQPDQSRQFFIQCDASDYALGSVLQQKDEITGKLRPIAFYSRKFTSAEANYEIYDKELLAIVDSLKQWRYLCIGTVEPVIIYSDHKNLRWFMPTRQLNRRQARWSLFLADFNFKLEIRPGALQSVADPLSRQGKHQLLSDDSMNSQVLLPITKMSPDFQTASRETSPPPSSRILGHIAALRPSSSDYDNDSTVSDTSYQSSASRSSSGSMESDAAEALWEADQLDDGRDPLWFKLVLQEVFHMYTPLVLSLNFYHFIQRQKKLFSLKNDRLYRIVRRQGEEHHAPYIPIIRRQEILSQYHVTLGHLALSSLLPVLETKCYWPGMAESARLFISKCHVCQLHRQEPRDVRPLHPHAPVGLPFFKWGIDFVQNLPPSPDGKRHIITAVDYATRYVVAKAVESMDAATAAQFLFELTCTFGAPVEIVSDRGAAFTSDLLARYLQILEIHHLKTTPYTPRSNGAVERMHRTLGDILTKLCAGHRTLWSKYLPQAVLALNSRIHSATGYSSFYLAHGCHPRLPGDELPLPPLCDLNLDDPVLVADATADELARLGQNRAAALARLKSQALTMKERYDLQSGVSSPTYQPGDVVKMKHHDKQKFQFCWTGPYYIVDKGLSDTYYIQKPMGARIDNAVNPDYLAPFSATVIEFYYDGLDNGLQSV
jgi:transposase InsO family protein